ncbi:MAG: hypothetical protein HKL80_01900 [Acidimicrobiales bacterium]|nr:hypothetical protein [Acidimicrobiales bacterium]
MNRSVFAPGRVNLIGDHTDYAGGLALPIAIQLGTFITFDPNERSETVLFHSDTQAQKAEVQIEIGKSQVHLVEPGWARFVAAAVALSNGVVGGSGSVRSNLPIGSGLSSSASFAIALTMALGIDTEDLVGFAQEVEHLATGVPCGKLDQMAIVNGKKQFGVQIDFRDLSYRYVEIPDEIDIFIVESGETRQLEYSNYSNRRESALKAISILGDLRKVSLDEVEKLGDIDLINCCTHIISENKRVVLFGDALSKKDFQKAGRLLSESHWSLSHLYNVSTPILDNLVERATSINGVLGARVTGAGFGGSVVVLSEPGLDLQQFLTERVIKVVPSNGANLVV